MDAIPIALPWLFSNSNKGREQAQSMDAALLNQTARGTQSTVDCSRNAKGSREPGTNQGTTRLADGPHFGIIRGASGILVAAGILATGFRQALRRNQNAGYR
jgi:hypothetical protein